MIKGKRQFTSPPLFSPRQVYVLHPMAVPNMAPICGERPYVWVLSLESPYGALVDRHDGDQAGAVKRAAAMLEKFAEMGQRSELRVRAMSGKLGESRMFPRSSDQRRSRG